MALPFFRAFGSSEWAERFRWANAVASSSARLDGAPGHDQGKRVVEGPCVKPPGIVSGADPLSIPLMLRMLWITESLYHFSVSVWAARLPSA